MKRFRGLIYAGAFALAACDLAPKLSPDVTLLAANGTAPAAGPDCGSCHRYPLHDVHHAFHLSSSKVAGDMFDLPESNGPITCMDCHFNSIRHFTYVHLDTVWVDVNGNELSHRVSPTDKIKSIDSYRRWHPVPYGGADTARGEALAIEIDSMVFRKARLGETVQWMTSFAHDNGSVDVAFAPNDLTSPGAAAAAYRPADLSCSAINCHSQSDIGYRWKDPAKGLGNCPSLTGNDPTCLNETKTSGAAP